jgi:hypothetical protein
MRSTCLPGVLNSAIKDFLPKKFGFLLPGLIHPKLCSRSALPSGGPSLALGHGEAP